jgi:hypothetical protein
MLIPFWIDSTKEEGVGAVVEIAFAVASLAKNLNWNIVQRCSSNDIDSLRELQAPTSFLSADSYISTDTIGEHVVAVVVT